MSISAKSSPPHKIINQNDLQELISKNKAQEKEISELKTKLMKLEDLKSLQSRVEQLEMMLLKTAEK